MKGLPLAYNKDLQEDKEALFDGVKTVRICLQAMTVGIPFREAYNLVGKVVKSSLAAGKLLKDLTLTEWQELHPAFEADIYDAIAPRQVVAARNSYGGTGFEQVRSALIQAKAILDHD